MTGAGVSGATPAGAAVALLAAVWWLQRQGRIVPDRAVSRVIGVIVCLLAILVLWGGATAVFGAGAPVPLPHFSGTPSILVAVLLAAGVGHAMSAVGSVDTLDHVALDLEQPRIRNLQRAGRLIGIFGLVIAAPLAFLFVALLPPDQMRAWVQAPLAGLALHLAGPRWLRVALFAGVAGAAVAFLAATVRSASAGAHGVLTRLVDEGVLRGEFRRPHPRFGTPFHLIDATATAQIAIVLLAAGQITWLAHVYAIGAIGSALLKTIALVRFRSLRPGKRPYRVKLNISLGKWACPLGLLMLAALLAVTLVGLVIALDPASLAGLFS